MKFTSFLNNFLLYNALNDNIDHSFIVNKTDIFYVLHCVEKAFGEISEEIVYNCWRKTGIFDIVKEDVYEDTEIKNELESEDDSNSEISTDSNDSYQYQKQNELFSTSNASDLLLSL
ncbi:hypothetical protein DMUE_3258 [Dictyocoela muelleri]|nr:hypothetical protein DMUE_3258 [Dictyocoela muelleri]